VDEPGFRSTMLNFKRKEVGTYIPGLVFVLFEYIFIFVLNDERISMQ